jgi:hypothetical protein
MTNKRNIINAMAIANGGSNISNSFYWSSIETDSDFAYVFDFSTNTFAGLGKQLEVNVRAMRAF